MTDTLFPMDPVTTPAAANETTVSAKATQSSATSLLPSSDSAVQERRTLARAYRPRQFEGLYGILAQEHVTQVLKNHVRTGRVANGYLFTGTRGVGKTTAARVLAMALNCSSSKEGEPCMECDTCTRLVDGRTTMDVYELDAATNRGVDDARDLREKVMYAPSEPGRYKVYILDEAHMLTREAWNALLKVLEEPPPRVIFVFATTEPQAIQKSAPPILSRCQRFDFRSIEQEDIASHLERVAKAERIAISEEAIQLLARRGRGSMRDALTALEQVSSFHFEPGVEITGETIRNIFNEPDERLVLAALTVFAQAGRTEDPKQSRRRALEGVEYCAHNAVDFVEFFRSVKEGLYDLYKTKAGLKVNTWSQDGLARLERLSQTLDIAEIQACLRLAQQSARQMREAGTAEDPHHVLTLFLLEGIETLERLRQNTQQSRLLSQVDSSSAQMPGSPEATAALAPTPNAAARTRGNR